MHQMQNKCKCKIYGAPLFKWLIQVVGLPDWPPSRPWRACASRTGIAPVTLWPSSRKTWLSVWHSDVTMTSPSVEQNHWQLDTCFKLTWKTEMPENFAQSFSLCGKNRNDKFWKSESLARSPSRKKVFVRSHGNVSIFKVIESEATTW